jgi:hypothetical protein
VSYPTGENHVGEASELRLQLLDEGDCYLQLSCSRISERQTGRTDIRRFRTLASAWKLPRLGRGILGPALACSAVQADSGRLNAMLRPYFSATVSS